MRSFQKINPKHIFWHYRNYLDKILSPIDAPNLYMYMEQLLVILKYWTDGEIKNIAPRTLVKFPSFLIVMHSTLKLDNPLY